VRDRVRAVDADDPGLERLPQSVEHGRVKLRGFVEEENAV
jgi:hypothetical protein